jgi:3'-phosphoadenosine 5'-phosphosulfate sulfotransferase (PAPS reductase)/FAD synthetase
VLYCKTGIGLAENFDYVLETCNKYGWHLHIEEPTFTYEDIIKKMGFPGEQMHHAVMGYLKWHSIRRFERKHRDEHIGFISGVRRKESKRRMNTHKTAIERPVGDKHLCFIKPIFDWSNKQVWDYINENGNVTCPVYNTLHLSGDCLCGCFAEPHESKLIAIFHPEMAQRIKALEERYGGRWGYGRGMSMRGALKQQTLDSLVCYECRSS